MYQVAEIEVNNIPRLAITLDEYPDVQFVLGAIEFKERGDKIALCYNYEVVDGVEPTDARFENAIGDFIMHYLENQAPQHPICFTGGTE